MSASRKAKAAAMAKEAAARAFAKKQRAVGEAVEIEVGGKMLRGRSARFTTEGDGVVNLTLDDGTRIRARLLIEDVVVTDKEQSPGIPIVATRHTVLVTQLPSLQKQ
jgi:hypothetical protein